MTAGCSTRCPCAVQAHVQPTSEERASNNKSSPGTKVQYSQLPKERALHDGAAIVALGADTNWENWTLDNLLAERPDKWSLSQLAEVLGLPVGYAIGSRRGDAVHLHHLVVDEPWRGLGIGRELLRRLAISAQAVGAVKMTLKVYSNNQRAIHFYERHGFKIVGGQSAELIEMAANLDRVLSESRSEGEKLEEKMPLGIVVPVRNEVITLPRLLASLEIQPALAYICCIAIVDGQSDDGSREIVETWRSRIPSLRIVNNPDRITPIALNLGIAACLEAGAEAVVLLGAHSWIANDYLMRLQDVLRHTDADIIGAIHTYSEAESAFEKAIRAFSESRLGRRLVYFSRINEPTETDVAFSPAIRRRVFEIIGGFDESMIRNQDNDFTSRAKEAGFRIETHPSLRYVYVPRSNAQRLIGQMFNNGLWVGRKPRSHSMRHLAPALYWSGGLLSVLTAQVVWNHGKWALLVWWGPYLLAVLATTGSWARSIGRSAIWLPLLFSVGHAAYALGTFKGLIIKLLSPMRKG